MEFLGVDNLVIYLSRLFLYSLGNQQKFIEIQLNLFISSTERLTTGIVSLVHIIVLYRNLYEKSINRQNELLFWNILILTD